MHRTGGAAVLAGLVLALTAPGPAWAHDRKLKLEVAGDGATGVTVQARHADGHRLDTTVRLLLTATAAGGRTVGPVQMEPAAEGHGFYTSGPILTPGSWRVTVRAPAPHTGEVSVQVRASVAQSAPVPAAPAAERGEPADAQRSWWWPAVLGVLAASAVAATMVAVARRRRADPTRRP